MRNIRYKVHWEYVDSTERYSTLAEFILDIPYLMENTGVIPPLAVLNSVLKTGGDSGGMGPATTWKPFQVDEDEYKELVKILIEVDVAAARLVHPYARFERAIVDDELNHCSDYIDWLTKANQKHLMI